MTFGTQARQELVEQDHLAAVYHEASQSLFFLSRCRLGAVKEEWMVARFLELHSDVEERYAAVAGRKRFVVLASAQLIRLRTCVMSQEPVLWPRQACTTSSASPTSRPSRSFLS